MILYLAGYKSSARRWNLDTSNIYLLSSFWEHKSGKYGEYVKQEKHILDSGAFSAFSGKNNNFDWDTYVKKYANFIIQNNIQKFFYFMHAFVFCGTGKYYFVSGKVINIFQIIHIQNF